MPSPPEILAGLSEIANRAFPLAVVWHGLVAAVLVAWIAGWRPRPRTSGLVLTLPLASVSVIAWSFGNPFNGLVFALLAIVLSILALRAPATAEHVEHRWPWPTIVGGSLVAIAWVYPHFLLRPPTAYLYGAPMGLLPCPTLMLVIGFVLVAGERVGRSAKLMLAAAGLFYAAMGVFQLRVWIDLPLLVAVAVLVLLALKAPAQGCESSSA
jgi:hypothetical protein